MSEQYKPQHISFEEVEGSRMLAAAQIAREKTQKETKVKQNKTKINFFKSLALTLV